MCKCLVMVNVWNLFEASSILVYTGTMHVCVGGVVMVAGSQSNKAAGTICGGVLGIRTGCDCWTIGARLSRAHLHTVWTVPPVECNIYLPVTTPHHTYTHIHRQTSNNKCSSILYLYVWNTCVSIPVYMCVYKRR